MLRTSLVIIVILFAYLCFWPVPIEPVSWDAPKNNGFVGDFAPNSRLSNIEFIELTDTHGPEGLAVLNGEVYAATREGWILRYNETSGEITKLVNTNGSPLGLAFDAKDNLLIADAYNGVLSLSPQGDLTVLTNRLDGLPIEYADDLDVTDDGRIYFSDATTKFGARRNGGTYAASLLDASEHGSYGRLLVYDPADRSTKLVMDGLDFANGVATAADSSFVLVNETSAYRINKYWLKGEKAGRSEIIIDNLPGFPDNIVRGRDGRFWVGLVSPRNEALDFFSNWPLIRAMNLRLPKSMQLAAESYSHVFAMDENGNIIISLQDPNGIYHTNTGAMETDDWLYISSLHADNLARIRKHDIGL